jgi:hypothetical protein
VIGHNELVEEDGTLRAKDSGEREELECGLVLRSVGCTGVPIEGVPFDEKRGLILAPAPSRIALGLSQRSEGAPAGSAIKRRGALGRPPLASSHARIVFA